MARGGRGREDARALMRGWDAHAEAGQGPGRSADGGTGRPTDGGRSRFADGGPGRSADGKPGRSADGDSAPRRPRRLLLLGLAAALVAGLLIGLPRLLTDPAGPEEAAREVLQALVDGDLDVVRAHVEQAPDASPAALREDVLAAAEGRVTSFTVGEVRVDGDRAQVDAELRTAEGTGAVTLPLSAAADGPFSRLTWQVGRVPLPEFLVPIPVGVTEVVLNGVPLPVADLMVQEGSFQPAIVMQLLPGRYTLTLPSSREHLTPIELELVAPPTLSVWRKPFDTPLPALDEAGEAEALAQAQHLLEECAAERPADEPGCPFGAPAQGERSSDTPLEKAGPGTWEILGMPELLLSPVDSYLWILDGTGTARFTPAPDASGEVGDAVVVPFVVEGSVVLHADGSIETALHPSGSLSYTFCLDAEDGEVLEVIVLDRLAPGEIGSDACG